MVKMQSKLDGDVAQPFLYQIAYYLDLFWPEFQGLFYMTTLLLRSNPNNPLNDYVIAGHSEPSLLSASTLINYNDRGQGGGAICMRRHLKFK